MKIVLIYPYGQIHRKGGSFKKALRYSPLTMTHLAALVPKELNAEIKIIDEGVEELTFDFEADIVGISVITGTSKRAYFIADKIRKEMNIPVVLGGVHVTLLPDEAQPHADAIITGFAEKMWPQLLHDFKSGNMQKRYEGSRKITFEQLPTPRRELLNPKNYITTNTIQATRGCLNTCDFCVIPSVTGTNFYTRPVNDVVAELEALPGKEVIFLDPSPIEDVDYAKKLFKAMIPLKKKWFGLSTVKIAQDKQLLNLAAKSGCKGLLLGLESVYQSSLKDTTKNFNEVVNYKQIVKRLHDKGIAIQGCFVFGFDSDNKDVFKRTVDFVYKTNIDLPRFSVYTPFPGTRSFKRLEAEGRIIERDWSLYDVQHVVFQPKQMSAKELQKGLHWAWKQAYSYKSIFKRIAGSRNLLKYILPLNLGYRHFAKNLSQFSTERLKKEN